MMDAWTRRGPSHGLDPVASADNNPNLLNLLVLAQEQCSWDGPHTLELDSSPFGTKDSLEHRLIRLSVGVSNVIDQVPGSYIS